MQQGSTEFRVCKLELILKVFSMPVRVFPQPNLRFFRSLLAVFIHYFPAKINCSCNFQLQGNNTTVATGKAEVNKGSLPNCFQSSTSKGEK